MSWMMSLVNFHWWMLKRRNSTNYTQTCLGNGRRGTLHTFFSMKQQNLVARILQNDWFEENYQPIYFGYIVANILNEIFSWNQQYTKRIKERGGGNDHITKVRRFWQNPKHFHDKQQNLSRLGTEGSFFHMKKLQSHDIYWWGTNFPTNLELGKDAQSHCFHWTLFWTS